MKRLDFVLPEWTRIIWNSKESKNIWEYRISKISNAFVTIEKQTVLAGIKPSWLTTISESELQILKQDLKDTEFEVHPLSKTPIVNSYSSSPQPYIEGQPYHYRIVLTHKNKIKDWKEAWEKSDNIKIGELLGFPICCQNFFQKYWIEEKYLDTSWVMSLSGTDGPKECNILLRWLGVRSVSHLPCSFSCQETYNIARKNIEWGYLNGFAQEMEWLEEMLDWPVQWSALHGIAEIRTPILKISTRTDATADMVVVDKHGFSYPKEGSSGTKFPYINKAKSIITQNNAFKRSILLENQWKDNGFSTFESMTHSHQILLKSLDILDKDKFYDIIDFGCGNAELLKSIQQRVLKNSKINGIEIHSDRFNRIKFNTSNLNSGDFYNSNMFDFTKEWFEKSYDLVILMPGRLSECNDSERITFLNWLNEKSKTILWYGYGDWINKNLEEPWKTMNNMDIEFNKIHSVSSDNCFASIGNLSKKNKKTQFQILG
jgi:hypothetical protein